MALIEVWISRGRAGLDEQWDPELGLCVDHDSGGMRRGLCTVGLRAARGGRAGAGPARRPAADALLDGLLPRSCGVRCRPRRAPPRAHFQPRNYWRGPVWPVISWLLWRSLVRAGSATAYDLRRWPSKSSGQLRRVLRALTGELGSDDQSWTAAVTLDWLSYDDEAW